MNDMETKCIPKMMTDISKEVEQQSNVMENRLNAQFKSYADVTATNITEKSAESHKIISSIEKNLSNVKENIEKKIDQDKEIIIKKRKVNNVIMFNILEADTGNREEDLKEDLQKFRKITNEKRTLVKEDIKAFFRIPAERKNSNPRPIIVTLSNNESNCMYQG